MKVVLRVDFQAFLFFVNFTFTRFLQTWCYVYVNDTVRSIAKNGSKRYTSTGNCMFSRYAYSCTDVTIERTCETAICCSVVVRSYIRRALMDR